jgi:hypothetical protein
MRSPAAFRAPYVSGESSVASSAEQDSRVVSPSRFGTSSSAYAAPLEM